MGGILGWGDLMVNKPRFKWPKNLKLKLDFFQASLIQYQFYSIDIRKETFSENLYCCSLIWMQNDSMAISRSQVEDYP